MKSVPRFRLVLLPNTRYAIQIRTRRWWGRGYRWTWVCCFADCSWRRVIGASGASSWVYQSEAKEAVEAMLRHWIAKRTGPVVLREYGIEDTLETVPIVTDVRVLTRHS